MIYFHSCKFYLLLKYLYALIFIMSTFKARKELFKIIIQLIKL